jgi:uncharacterized protein YndB with AHSA1/START domain
MRLVVTQRIAAPREAVFQVISDPRRRQEWQSSLLEVNVHTPGPPGVGTRWREVTLGWVAFEMEITEHEPPSRWSERGHGYPADAVLTVDFAEAGTTATDVKVTVEVAFKGPFKVLAPLVRRLMPRALSADLRRAEALARAVQATPT